MIIVMKPGAAKQSIEAVTTYIKDHGLQVHLSAGEQVTIIGIIGDKTRISAENLTVFQDVDNILPVTESYKLTNLKFHPEPTMHFFLLWQTLFWIEHVFHRVFPNS